MIEPFATFEEFAEALGELMARASGLEADEVIAELDGQVMALREREAGGES